MKKKNISKDEDDLLESDLFDRQEEKRPKKLFDRNTLFFVIIFSLTFFVLGNATGFFLLDKAGRSRQTDPSFYADSSTVRSNPITNDLHSIERNGQSPASQAESDSDASSDEPSGQAANPSDDADKNASRQQQAEGNDGKADNTDQTGKSSTAVTRSGNHSNGTTVYVTPSGKKYHYSASCGGDNSYETTLEEALSEGKTPCKKCAQ